MEETIKAYIAGFLYGDGSIFFQLVRRKDNRLGYEIRASVCFYQHSAHLQILNWLKEKLGVGYIRDRKNGVCDYNIVGYKNVEKVINILEPYVILKREHIEKAKQIINMMKKTKKPTPENFLKIARLVDEFSALNFSKKKTQTSESVREFFESKGFLTPVTTDVTTKSL